MKAVFWIYLALVFSLFLVVQVLAGPMVTFTGTVQPAATSGSCGSPPDAAVNAGFTTCVLFSDFTQTIPSGYIDCNGGDSTTATWYRLGAGTGCNTIFQTTDQGGTVLDLQWIPAYGTRLIYLATVSNDNTVGTTYPYGYYETTFRLQSNPDNGGSPNFEDSGAHVDFWLTVLPNSYVGIEHDIMEFFESVYETTPCASDQQHNGGGGNESFACGPSQPNMRDVYRTWGELITGTNGGQSDTACMFYNGSQTGCASLAFNNSGNDEGAERWIVLLQTGIVCQFPPVDLSCMESDFTSLDLLIKTVKVWSCSSWRTSKCATS